MVFVRVIVLVFWTTYAWGMGQYSDLNAFGRSVAFSFFVAAPALYLLPIYEAALRKHPNLTGIAILDVLLGWTLVGWTVALVWACKKQDEPSTAAQLPAGARAAQPTKTCPFCAEEILAAAVKCKHCGSAV